MNGNLRVLIFLGFEEVKLQQMKAKILLKNVLRIMNVI